MDKNTISNRKDGVLVWITGLPGSGKTTLSREVYELIKHVVPSIRMDGDVFREIMGNDLGYNMADRKVNAFRLAKMNKYLVEHGLVVVCATVSLFNEIHKWNRDNITNVIEVYINVPEEILHSRDQKNMYSQAKAGENNHVYGINQPYEVPEKPEIVINNDGSIGKLLSKAEEIKDLIMHKIGVLSI